MSPARDKPHSPWAPIGLGLVAAAALVASSPLPAVTSVDPPFAATAAEISDSAPWWTSGDHPVAVERGAWDAVSLLVPVGERGVRGEAAALGLVLAIAAAAGLLAFRLYRGTGRWAAATVAVPLTAALLFAWLLARGAAFASATAPLGFTLLATLAVCAAISARVHGAGVGRATWLRAGSAATAAAVLWPAGGLGFAAALLTYLAWHRGAGRGAALLGLPVAGGLGLWWFGHGGMDMSLMTGPIGQDVGLDRFLGLSRLVGPALLDPALALLALMVALLRWRGGGLLLALSVATIAGACVPAALVLVAVAACGWIWLAGGLRVRARDGVRRIAWVPRVAVVVASATVLALAGVAAGPRVTAPISASRPEHALLAVVHRGLVAPGDVLLAHDPWLAAALTAAQREGVRPDVVVLAAAEVDPTTLSDRIAGWQREGRRVLSDSFSYAGRWQAAWVLDSGPLFWLVGGVDLGEREFTDLHAYTPDLADPALPPAERTRWEQLHLERVRHRRALGRHDAAALALPLDDDTRAEISRRVHLAELSRLAAIEGSELGPAAWSAAAPPAASLAEAGDLLLALGDSEAGAHHLERAATRGVVEAFGALARWYLRAGEEAAARETLTVMVDASLRPQMLGVCRWLVARARVDQATALLTGLPHAPGHAPEELGTRLAVLRGLAGAPRTE
jgi:hypothetical protein